MNDFKLLAIRPLKGCEQRFLKNLIPNEIYLFYNDYKFYMDDEQKEIIRVEHMPTYPDNFFHVDKPSLLTKSKTIRINISAVVGKNGSGKSAISELLLYSLFLISNKLEFIDKNQFLKLDSKEQVDIDEKKRFESDTNEIIKGLKVEIIYLLNKKINIIKFENGELNRKVGETVGQKNFFNGKEKINVKEDLFPFFYSMLVNYSLYGFNENEIGMWIKAFFHKNDGYQMPVVINPYREKGIIDINKETYLTRSRLLANVLSIEGYNDINPKASISKIKLYLDEFKNYKVLNSGEVRFTAGFIAKFRQYILRPLYYSMFKNEDYPSINNPIKEIAEIYLIQKLITIPTRYSTFSRFDRKKRKMESQDNFDIIIKDAIFFVEKVYQDRSHITLKVRQTLNFLHRDIFNLSDHHEVTEIDPNEVVKKIHKMREENWFTDTIDYLPPPFLVSRIQFDDDSYFSEMSSGEKQKIYFLNSIIYHLKNIDSVHKNYNKNQEEEGVVTYNSINLILDEIELYYHPNFQKNIIFDLLSLIEKAQYEFIDNLNILFLTHSPFILSDIPHQNILKLNNGKKEPYLKQKKSFGANIYSLLDDSFFMDNTIGKFAEEKMKSVLEFLDSRNEQQTSDQERIQLKQIIGIMGEPMIREQLEYLYRNKFGQDEVGILKERIKELENQLKANKS